MFSNIGVSRGSIGLVLGPTSFLGLALVTPFGLTPEVTAVLASTTWVVIWWVTEAIPIPVTSLLPVVLFPTTGVMTVGSATAPYADPIVFLLLGGFLIALAIERWNLHHRLSLLIISTVGTSGKGLVFGFMGATAFLSMWISNTATAMMMVPIGAAVVVELTAIGGRKTPPLDRDELEAPNDPLDVEGELLHGFESDAAELPNTSFGLAVMLGIAYGASIGGAATLIGSPPNAVLAGVAESSLGVEIGFLDWMLVGVPIAVIFLLITWVLLVVVLRPTIDRRPGRTDVIDAQLRELGAMTNGERRVLAVFGLVAACWIARPFVLQPVVPMLTDAMIAVAGAVLVFLIPVDGDRLLDWEYTARVPWGVLLLLGAGFSIARGFQESGLDDVVADAIATLGITELAGMVLLIATVVILLTNVTSNTATASLFMPITVSIGAAIGVTPLTLMTTAAFAASFAFMLPVATAPNAIVFGSGYLTIPQMAKIGFVVTLPAILVISAFAIWWIPLVWA
ncbi:DASS family sodium-coupled anion symporter [Halorubrum sp. CBA1125]|uniref:SLC13 family permease n=1 Tax=Halorubrum sp. CBA1125 TaxID=2668072 RepID=UPI0012E8FC85|nr:DASS family sodium-coupled anion symporter [Halorubrum sp. CBA1125]MUW13658.1 DASS family sodium-coupled anion symporter [Halorubrum sp. CBA1125]